MPAQLTDEELFAALDAEPSEAAEFLNYKRQRRGQGN